MATVLEDYGLVPVTARRITGLGSIVAPAVINSNEIIGIEVEVENARGALGTNPNPVWVVTEDNSLRNNGLEMITKPIAASAAPVCLEYLLNTYLNKEECCFSPRTSVHVHLNVQDITRAQVMDIILLYTVFEKLFYKFAGRGRQKNIYCVPLSDCNLLRNLVDLGETRDRQWQKYTGLNTLPISDKGTIEFRHMHGTSDVVKLSNWIALICKLKEYVRGHSTKEIRMMLAEMYEGYDYVTLLRSIFGDLMPLLKYEGPQEMNFLQAKQAMVSRGNTTLIVRGYSNTSAFAKFKG